MIAQVAVSDSVYAIDRPYSYRIPDGLTLRPGMRVLVPFGNGNRKKEAVVLAVSAGEEAKLKAVEQALDEDPVLTAEQLRLVNGYDHHFCVDGAGLRRAAVLRGDSSGIAMTMDTTSPGVQLYTANWLSRRGGKNGAVYEPRCAVCLEPQFPPDAVHHPNFPQPLLRRGEVYRHCTVYSFSK